MFDLCLFFILALNNNVTQKQDTNCLTQCSPTATLTNRIRMISSSLPPAFTGEKVENEICQGEPEAVPMLFILSGL